MTSVDICNLSLAYLGDTATVTSIDPPEGSVQAQHCARFYPIALNLCLEAHQWNFITKRAYLAVVANETTDGWGYAYGMPSDASDIISVQPKACYPAGYFSSSIRSYYGNPWPFEWENSNRDNFEIETGAAGQVVILSNVYEAIARYTCTTVQPGMFPAMFTDALAWKLASMLAGPLLKGDVGAAESKRCLQMYAATLEQAKSQDANQRHGNRQPVAPWIAVRQ